jgi:predicted amidohydrolase
MRSGADSTAAVAAAAFLAGIGVAWLIERWRRSVAHGGSRATSPEVLRRPEERVAAPRSSATPPAITPPRTITVAISSLGVLEPFSPPFNIAVPTVASNLKRGLEVIDAAGRSGAQLALLPEVFTLCGVPIKDATALAEALDGSETIAMLRERARHHAMHIVAGMLVVDGHGRTRNSAVVIDDCGDVVGTYAKHYPVGAELDTGVTPGGLATDPPTVVSTRLGRIGLAICFDVNWPGLWTAFRAQRADIAVWLSAYPGGMPLQCRALDARLPILTSVQGTQPAKYIDLSGRVLAKTSRWQRVRLVEVNLTRRLCHTDGQAHKLLALQSRYGARIAIETLDEEHLFVVESLDGSLPIEELMSDSGLVEYADYIDTCTRRRQARIDRVDRAHS